MLTYLRTLQRIWPPEMDHIRTESTCAHICGTPRWSGSDGRAQPVHRRDLSRLQTVAQLPAWPRRAPLHSSSNPQWPLFELEGATGFSRRAARWHNARRDGELSGNLPIECWQARAGFDRWMVGVRGRATPPGSHHGFLCTESSVQNQGVLQGV